MSAHRFVLNKASAKGWAPFGLVVGDDWKIGDTVRLEQSDLRNFERGTYAVTRVAKDGVVEEVYFHLLRDAGTRRKAEEFAKEWPRMLTPTPFCEAHKDYTLTDCPVCRADAIEARVKGSDERAMTVLRAKDKWADKARVAELEKNLQKGAAESSVAVIEEMRSAVCELADTPIAKGFQFAMDRLRWWRGRG